jgi:hypothetical protein
MIASVRAGLPDFPLNNIPKGENIYIPNYLSITEWSWNIQTDRKIYQMTIKYTNIFHSKALQNLVFLVWKYTIWQPWVRARTKTTYAIRLISPPDSYRAGLPDGIFSYQKSKFG